MNLNPRHPRAPPPDPVVQAYLEAERTARIAPVCYAPVEVIRFTQCSMTSTFSGGDHDGVPVNSLVENLLSGNVQFWLARWLAGWPAGWLARLASWLAARLAGCLGWLAGWLAGCKAIRLQKGII